MQCKAKDWISRRLEEIPALRDPFVGRLRKAIIEKTLANPAKQQNGEGSFDLALCLDWVFSHSADGSCDVFVFSDFHDNKRRKWIVFDDASAIVLSRDGRACAMEPDEFRETMEQFGNICEQHGHWSGPVDQVRRGLDGKGPSLAPKELLQELRSWCKLSCSEGYGKGLGEFSAYARGVLLEKFGIGKNKKAISVMQ